MIKIRKLSFTLLALFLLGSVLPGCGGDDSGKPKTEPTTEEKLKSDDPEVQKEGIEEVRGKYEKEGESQ